MGPLSDVYGRKPFILLSLFGSCFGSIFQGMSRDVISLIIWRSFTGLFSGSLILVQAYCSSCSLIFSVIADIIPAEQRNTYLTRLEGCISAAYIIGPAVGGVLAQVNYHFPMYVAGVISGIAMVIALFILKESHPGLILILEKQKKEPKKSIVKPRITLLMLSCFVSEFCIRWAASAYDSRYGIYLSDKFEIKSFTYSSLIVVVVVQSLVCLIMHVLIYPLLTTKLCIPIPYLCIVGYLITIGGYIGMSASTTMMGSIIASSILWIGYPLVTPTSVSIISTTHSKDVQGTVLSWNNFCYQGSLIICPLVLSAIYSKNRDAIFYFSSVLSLIGLLVVSPLACRKDVKTLGKVSLLDTQEMPIKQDIELKPLENNLDASLDKQKTMDVSPTVDNSAVVNVTVDSQVP
ncbi:MFS transporter [Blastocystis sp. subtype 4]|uniref:MFS transporter n=1 Tax=Blastocystis sp. subtype 4 TaxID=944170 RepID=UPI0007121635|nr:MFS transporter [Blastocystis sp. subtype 4]KNB43926.1 MFS transporter [Blastocystis sp. subtype 4]|eukprot:XP_014527367.1 MFS transporter [Blastocystis sp. subtype 4]